MGGGGMPGMSGFGGMPSGMGGAPGAGMGGMPSTSGRKDTPIEHSIGCTLEELYKVVPWLCSCSRWPPATRRRAVSYINVSACVNYTSAESNRAQRNG